MAGVRAAVQLPVDGAGKKLDSFSYDLSDGRGTVYTNTFVVCDANGVVVDTLNVDTGVDALLVAAAGSYFDASAGNSSVAQLGAGATFTGTVETVFNQQAVSVLVTSDQAGTLHLMQYIDAGGTRKIADWAYPIAAGVPFSRSLVANGNYFNLTFTNNGGSTTTTLNINTAYGTLQPSTNLGSLPVSIAEPDGRYRTAMGYGVSAASVPTAGTSGTDAMLTLAQQYQGYVSQGTTGTSFTVPAGKTFRVSAMTVYAKANGAYVNTQLFTLRYNPSGTCATSSPAVLQLPVSCPATNGWTTFGHWQNTDGFDLPSGGQFGISCLPTWATTAPSMYAFISGYLY